MSSKVFTVIGARPQFIKATVVSRALKAAGVSEILCHTGQHYDPQLSEVFFRELGIPPASYELGLGGGSHGQMTARMLEAIESIVMKETPGLVLVYGDTNSTLAGALAAAKLHVPVAHVEAGLRSFNKRMPEEINRLVTDHVAALLFCSSDVGASNLQRENITKGVEVVGDVMADSLEMARALLRNSRSRFLPAAAVGANFALMTLHRAENTDDPERLRSILDASSSCKTPFILPLHPRTRNAIEANCIRLPSNVTAVEPAGYLQMACLIEAADFVMTDSGGLQKEAYWCAKPCITLREETEWVETVEAGWNVLVGANVCAIRAAMADPPRGRNHPALYGDGKAAERVAARLREFLS
ncbi:MAG: non-hydrolyzing UDP-N-acetylglucosamine 2-epimerase [Verrucomicrobiales bacterium]